MPMALVVTLILTEVQVDFLDHTPQMWHLQLAALIRNVNPLPVPHQ